jgi:hypothetical protein
MGAGEPAGPAPRQLTLPTPRPSTSPGSPTWASVARGVAGVRAGEPSCPRQPPTVSAADFTELYDRCLASGLKARIIFNHAAGRQTLTVTCHLSSPAVTTAATGKSRRRHRRRRRRSRAAIAVPDCPAREAPTTLSAPTAPSPTQTQPTPPSPDIVSPLAKRTRKQRNELELLRDWEGNDDLLVSPPPLVGPRRHRLHAHRRHHLSSTFRRAHHLQRQPGV